MSASVRDESGIFVDFHFSEWGDLEFCSTFLRFRKVGARDAVWMVRVCAGGEVFHHEGHESTKNARRVDWIGWECRGKAIYRRDRRERREEKLDWGAGSAGWGEDSPRRHGEHKEGTKKGMGLGGKAGERQLTAAIRLVAQAPSGRSRPFGSQSLAQGGEAPEEAERDMRIDVKAGTERLLRRREGRRWIGFEPCGDRRWDKGLSKGEGAVLSGERNRAPRPQRQAGGFRRASTRPHLRAPQATC